MSRVVVALGGNAIVRDGDTGPRAQEASVGVAMEQVAELVAGGDEVVITHGNGPQVGNLLLKNELARDVVPAVPLHWCVAQTQATIGFLIANALEHSLRTLATERQVTAVVTRVVVAADDPAWSSPSKPIGEFRPMPAEAQDETWREFGERGWRRVVASPEPREIVELETIRSLLNRGSVVVAAGGGGVPVVRDGERFQGIDAVIDKDLSGALLAHALDADVFVIATDVKGAALRFGQPDEEWLGLVSTIALRGYAVEGFFAHGSMGPKVEAALRFVEAGGRKAAIASLSELVDAAAGRAGTLIQSGA